MNEIEKIDNTGNTVFWKAAFVDSWFSAAELQRSPLSPEFPKWL